METEPTTQEQKPKKNWFRRHPIFSGLLGLFLLLWFVGFITEVTSKNTSPTTARSVTSSHSSISPTETQKPTETPTTTPTISTPTRKPVSFSPTAFPTFIPVTSLPLAPNVTSQQTSQTNNGATALCNDGTYSYAEHEQGACSHHQGVKEFYK